jgi:hypothetical protein
MLAGKTNLLQGRKSMIQAFQGGKLIPGDLLILYSTIPVKFTNDA